MSAIPLSMSPLLLVPLATFILLVSTTGLLHLLGKLGQPGRAIQDALSRAPLVDLVLFHFTMLPPIAALALWTFVPSWREHSPWALLALAIAGQLAALITWTILHELAHPAIRKGPRLVKSIHKNVGPIRNNLALYWMLWAVPCFNVVRLSQYVVYPVLCTLTKLPRYRSRDWVNLSRQKFTGLVGHDLVWCLYCDWMTGVWSLGTEMLRNIEGFWCPIRFNSPEKCTNCTLDFPDLNHWVKPDATITDAAAYIDTHYPDPKGDNSWLGHPSRGGHIASVTVEGRKV